MKTIYKYPINPVIDSPVMEMPRGAKVLSFQTQYGIPCIWALVDTDVPTESRRFRLVGTGLPADDVGGAYIGTIQLSGGSLILHLFEV